MTTLPSNYHIDIEDVIAKIKNGKTIPSIASEIGCAKITLYQNLQKAGVNIEEISPKYLFKDKKWLQQQFDMYGTPTEVSKQTKMPRTSITRFAIKYGIYKKSFSREKTNNINENYFDVIDSEHKAYWLGFFMADANMYHRKDGKYQFYFGLQKKDGYIIEQLADDICFDKTKIKVKQGIRNDTITYTTTLKTYNQHFCNSLLKLGIVPLKSGKEIIPNLNPSLIKHFVRGFFDGDGNIFFHSYDSYIAKSISFCSLSKMILCQIYDLCVDNINVQFCFSSQKTKNHDMYRISLQNYSDICKMIHYMYDEATIYLNRKFETACKIIEAYEHVSLKPC